MLKSKNNRWEKGVLSRLCPLKSCKNLQLWDIEQSFTHDLFGGSTDYVGFGMNLIFPGYSKLDVLLRIPRQSSYLEALAILQWG